MEIDESDGNDGHIYRLKKMTKYRMREINETNLVQHTTEELILLM